MFACLDGRMDRAFASEAADSGLIPRLVEPITLKLGIHSFSALTLSLKGTLFCNRRINMKPNTERQ